MRHATAVPARFARPRQRIHLRPLPALLAIALLAALPLARARAENWALLIGIDRYQDGDNINALGGADGDALALAKALTEVANFPGDGQHVRVLTSGGDAKFLPLKNRILRELETLRQRVKPGDTVFVSFSGHGVESGGVPYLLPYDADISTGDLIRDTGIAEEKFRDYLRSVPAAAVIVAFDMCRVNADRSGRSGGGDARLTAGQVRGLDFARPAGEPAVGATHPGIVATFFACAAEQRSYEWREKGRGYFSYYLEQGLRGKAADASGAVSLDGLKRYLSSAVPDAVRREELGKAQTPTGRIEGSLDAGGFVLARGAKGKGGGKAAPAPVPEPVTEVANASVMDTKARLTVSVNAPGAAVAIDGVSVAGGVFAANLLDEKERTVRVKVTADGYEGQILTVNLLPGKSLTLPVALVAVAAPVPPPAVMDAAAAVVDSVSSGRFTPPLTLARYKAQMVRIPAGAFTMGSDTSAYKEEKPAHKVTLSAYRIGRTDVTVGMYEEFCQATKRAMPSEPNFPDGNHFNAGWGKKDHPIVNVSWDDAQAYCAWAGMKLPSEAQWEKAARGSDGREYPWGNEFDEKKLWCSTAQYGDAGGTRVVGDFPAGASPYGCLDMAGNVWQWCSDWYGEGFYGSRRATEADPVNESPSGKRVVRGGSWYDNVADLFRCANRYWGAPTIRYDSSGFRAVLPGLP